MVKRLLKTFRSPDADDYSQIFIEHITIASNDLPETNSSQNQRENVHDKVSV